jgi:rhodanese-related sulfurtransferase
MNMQHNSRFLQLVDAVRPHVQHIEALQLLHWMNTNHPMYIIDVREKEEFEQGHLPGAMHLSKGVLERDIERLVASPDADIVVYCSGGFRSILAAEALQKMGYSKVKSLIAGAKAWQASGLPWQNDSPSQ